MSSIHDRGDEDSLEQWMARLSKGDVPSLFDSDWSLSGASDKLSEANMNLLEGDMNRESIVSSILPTEHDKPETLELESLPKHSPPGITDTSSVRPPLQPSNSRSSNLEAVVHGKGSGRKRFSPVRGHCQARVQHSMTERRRLRSSTKPGSLQVRLRCVAGDAKGISRALDVLRKDRNFVAREKRPRSPTWSAEEKQAYLVLKEEASRVIKGKHWDFISQNLRERWGFERSSKCCEHFWYTILKSYRAVREHELLENDPQRSKWRNYWDMDEEERFKKHLPKSFSLEWCEMIEKILTTQEKRFVKKGRVSMAVQELFEDEDDVDEFSYQQPQLSEQPHMSSQEEMANLEHTSRERFCAIFEEPRVQQQVDDAVDSALQLLGCRKRLGSSTEEDDPITTLSTLAKQRVHDAINEDDLMTSLLPFFKKYIEDVLERKLRPVVSALQVRDLEEREEQKYQEQVRALAEKKRAIALEEMQLLKRRPVSRHLRPSRASYKQRGPHEKKSTTEGVILV